MVSIGQGSYYTSLAKAQGQQRFSGNNSKDWANNRAEYSEFETFKVPNNLEDYNNEIRKGLGKYSDFSHLSLFSKPNSESKILYHPDRIYRLAGKGAYEDFLKKKSIVDKRGNSPYFTLGFPAEQYFNGSVGDARVNQDREIYLFELEPKPRYKDEVLKGFPVGSFPVPDKKLLTTKNANIRVFKAVQKDGKTELVQDSLIPYKKGPANYEIVYDDIKDKAFYEPNLN